MSTQIIVPGTPLPANTLVRMPANLTTTKIKGITLQLTDPLGQWAAATAGNIQQWGLQLSRDNGQTWQWDVAVAGDTTQTGAWIAFGGALPQLTAGNSGIASEYIMPAGIYYALAIITDTAITLGATLTVT